MKRRILSAIITTALTLSALSLSACRSEKSLETTDLMTGIKAASHETVKPDDAFKSAYGNFSVELLKKCFDGKSNTLISPLSVSSALTMTANGANGQTKGEMEKVLGSGMPLDELNKYLSSFSGSLTSGEDFKLKNANSIWFIKDNNFNVNNEFLQTNADFYHAEIYKRAYNSEIVNDINNWVSEHTDGMIDKLLDNGDALSNIALINATAFDAKWENYYYDNFVEDGTFTDANGNEQSVTMLISEESETAITAQALSRNIKAVSTVSPQFSPTAMFLYRILSVRSMEISFSKCYRMPKALILLLKFRSLSMNTAPDSVKH